MDSQRSWLSFLCPSSWAVLMPIPPMQPIETAMPSLPKADSGSTPSRSGRAIHTKAATKPTYWIGRKA